jgi:membrane protein
VKLPAAIENLARRLMGWRAYVVGRHVLGRYEAAGGGLLAGGLTYSALFALLPLLLLVSGVLGLVVDDPERRRAIVEGIGESVPPIRGLVEASLDSIADGAVAFGVIGLIGFTWGVSRFYGALDEAFARIFVDAPRRGLIEQTIRGIVSVGLIVGAFMIAEGLSAVGTRVAEADRGLDATGNRVLFSVLSLILSTAAFVGAVAAVYRRIPVRYIPWRSLFPPAVVVGIILAALTQLFSFIAPRLIGSAAVYGTFVAVFAAMVWLSTGFQVLLIGAAWVRVRVGDEPSAADLDDVGPGSDALAAPAASAEAGGGRE